MVHRIGSCGPAGSVGAVPPAETSAETPPLEGGPVAAERLTAPVYERLVGVPGSRPTARPQGRGLLGLQIAQKRDWASRMPWNAPQAKTGAPSAKKKADEQAGVEFRERVRSDRRALEAEEAREAARDAEDDRRNRVHSEREVVELRTHGRERERTAAVDVPDGTRAAARMAMLFHDDGGPVENDFLMARSEELAVQRNAQANEEEARRRAMTADRTAEQYAGVQRHLTDLMGGKRITGRNITGSDKAEFDRKVMDMHRRLEALTRGGGVPVEAQEPELDLLYDRDRHDGRFVDDRHIEDRIVEDRLVEDRMIEDRIREERIAADRRAASYDRDR